MLPPPQTLTSIKALLEERGLSPRKNFGQNFLIDGNMLRKLVEVARVRAGDVVLEVGPGTGVLTDALLGAGAQVVACEIDRGLAQHLRERYAGVPTFTLVEGDAMPKLRLSQAAQDALAGRPFSLVANLPYGIASPLMIELLASFPQCQSQVVTIQREVAQRLLAKPGTDDYGTLGILAQSMASVKRIADLPPGCFWPQPSITSSFVQLTRLATPLTNDPQGLASVCTWLFSGRRRQLGTMLAHRAKERGVAVPALPAGLDPMVRAETLGVEDFVRLVEVAKGAGLVEGG
jgi:16S rRNA (adenine1518-N6/adenine1519-N6)-dimethyltransferase